MIIVQLQGGLGNQMFQYACGRALAEKYHTILALDTQWFLSATAKLQHAERKYMLDHLNVNASILLVEKVERLKKHFHIISQDFNSYGFSFKLSWLAEKYHPVYRRFQSVVEQEEEQTITNIVSSKNKSLYLQGYWQNENYFNEIKNTLLQEFSLKDGFSEKDESLAESLRSTNSVGIHIRRGDYVSIEKVNQFHGVLPVSYYQNAVEYIENEVNNPVFFVFTDDPDWCRENLQIKNNFTLLSNDQRNSAHELLLMSSCRHQIIANSSFSWWAAWLNRYDQKIIIGPQQWRVQDNQSPMPDRWIKLS